MPSATPDTKKPSEKGEGATWWPAQKRLDRVVQACSDPWFPASGHDHSWVAVWILMAQVEILRSGFHPSPREVVPLRHKGPMFQGGVFFAEASVAAGGMS